jgi:hypothetical protein
VIGLGWLFAPISVSAWVFAPLILAWGGGAVVLPFSARGDFGSVSGTFLTLFAAFVWAFCLLMRCSLLMIA